MEPTCDSRGRPAVASSSLPEGDDSNLRRVFRAAVDSLFGIVQTARSISTQEERAEAFEVSREEKRSSFKKTEIVRTSARQFLLGNWGGFKALPEVVEFSEQLATLVVKYGRPPVFSNGTRDRNLELLRDTCVWLGRDLNDDLFPSDAEIKLAADGFIRWYFDDLLPVEEVAYLSNFDSKVELLELPGGVRIERVPDAEFARRVFDHGTRVDFLRTGAEWRAVWHYLASRDEYCTGFANPSRLRCLETAIRLLGPGLTQLFDLSSSSTLCIVYNGQRRSHEEPLKHGLGIVLNKQREPELVHLYQQIYQDNYADNLQMIRFLESGNARNIDDRVAKLVIALEGLFVRERGDQISYRLALRAAKTLRQSPTEREELFRRLILIYGIRSDILHGGKDFHTSANERKLKKVGLTVETLPIFLDEVCRTALCRRLFDPASFESDALDALVLSGT